MKYHEMKAIVDFLSKTEGENTPEWQAAINNLNSLMKEMKPYQDPEVEGQYPSISQQDYDRINKLFDDTVASTNKFIKENNNNNNIVDDIRIQLSKNLNKEFLSKSYVEFKNVKPNPDKSLYESMENFRYENVELSNADLNRLGGNLSSRIQMNIDLDGKKVKGVFTKATTYDPNKQYADILNEMKLKYGAFNSFWDSMKNEQFMREGFVALNANLFMNSASHEVYDSSPEAKERAYFNTTNLAAMDGYPQILNEFNKYRDDPDFYGALFDLSTKAEKLGTSIGVSEEFLGLEPGQEIDNRNSAMSSVANLLGQSDLIAKSKTIAVKMPDGTFQKGTFMEFVDSKDISNVDSIDEMRVYGIDAYDSKEVKTQLANLQALDYICGNVDRHPGNMLYRFDSKTHKLAGIKGIDNDASFFKASLEKNESASQLPGLKQMRVIDEHMAEKLLSIDEGMLGATLHGYGLSEQEINAAWDRLHNLQEAIKEAPTFDPEKGLQPYDANGEGYGLTIVKSEDWNKLSLKDLKCENNYFGKIIGAQKTITQNGMVTYKMKENVEVSKRSVKAMLKQENSKLLLDKARSHKPFMGTSTRYTNVLNALANYHNTPVADDPLSEAGQAKWNSAVALKQAVDAYNQEKIRIGHFDSKGNPARAFSGNALHRIEDVKEIGQFVDKLMETKKFALDSQRTLDVATQKQRELDEFKGKTAEEQQAILDQKHAQEEEKNQDLSVRIKNSLDEDSIDNSDDEIVEDMSVESTMTM